MDHNNKDNKIGINERWRELCALASVEKDPARLMQLVAEISRLLNERDERIRASDMKPAPSEET